MSWSQCGAQPGPTGHTAWPRPGHEAEPGPARAWANMTRRRALATEASVLVSSNSQLSLLQCWTVICGLRCRLLPILGSACAEAGAWAGRPPQRAAGAGGVGRAVVVGSSLPHLHTPESCARLIESWWPPSCSALAGVGLSQCLHSQPGARAPARQAVLRVLPPSLCARAWRKPGGTAC